MRRWISALVIVLLTAPQPRASELLPDVNTPIVPPLNDVINTLSRGVNDNFALRDGTNLDLPSARLELLPPPTNGNCLVGNGSDWTSGTCAGGGMLQDASNATMPDALKNLTLQIPASCSGYHSYTGNMTSGSAVITDNSANFTSADIGKLASVAGAGSTKFFGTATIVGGGAGHAVGEEIAITGGTGVQGYVVVREVGGSVAQGATGAITKISGKPLALGKYTAVPANPVTVGDATINITWNTDNLVTTIAGVTDATHATLAATAGTTVASTLWGYDTDHAAEINAAIAAKRPFRLPPDSICGVGSTVNMTANRQMLLGWGTGGYNFSPSQLMWLGAVDGTVLKLNNGSLLDGIQVGPVGITGLCAASKIVEIHGVQDGDMYFVGADMKDIGVDLNMSDNGLWDSLNNRLTRGGAAANEVRCSQSATAVLLGLANNAKDVNNNSFRDFEVLNRNGIGIDLRQGYINTFYNAQVFTVGFGPGLHLGASNVPGEPNLSARRNAFYNTFIQGDIIGDAGSALSCIGNTAGPLNVSNTTRFSLPGACLTYNLVSSNPPELHQGGKLLLGEYDTDTLQTNYRTTSGNNNRNRLYFDLQDSAGTRQTYGGIGAMISSNTAGAEAGHLNFYTTSAGNVNETARLFSFGAFAVGSVAPGKVPCLGCVALDNAGTIQWVDTGGTLRSTLQLWSDNRVYLDGGSSGIRVRSNNQAVTAFDVDASGNTSFSQQVKADSYRAVNASSGSHTLNNDGTNTDINASTGGNLDLRINNATIMRVTGSGASMQTGTITVPTPSGTTDAVNKAYADSISSGVVTHASAPAATTANLTATYANGAAGVGATLTNSGAMAAFAVDGYSAALNDRILVKNQTTTFQNGIYTVTTVGSGAVNWVLTRATDFDAAAANEVAAGASIIVVGGSTNAKTQWVETGQGPFTIGTTPIIFDQVQGASSSGTVSSGTANQLGYYASNGTTISGLTTGNNGVLATNGSGVPAITSTIPSATQDNITRLGTVSSGVWNGTILAQLYGGTGADLSATGGASQVLKQTGAGAPITVGTLSCADLSDDAASCATDATNASNITSGTLASARGGAGAVNGALKGNGLGAVSQAQCTDLSDDGTACTANTGTSGHNLGFLDGANTASGVNTFSNTTDSTSTSTGGVILSGGLGVAKNVTIGGRLGFTGSAPTVATCGTSPSVSGTNNKGIITIGTGTVTACTLNFTASFWSSTPSCVLTLQGGTAATIRISSVTTTSMVVAISASGNAAIHYHCLQ